MFSKRSIINTKHAVNNRLSRNGGSVNGNRLAMCALNCESDSSSLDNDKMSIPDDLINKLSKIKIINPKNGARAKSQDKYITI